MWNAFILLFMESTIEIMISAYLNIIYSGVFSTKSDYFSKILSYCFIAVETVVLPLAFVYMLSKPISYLKMEHVTNKIGVMYEGLNSVSKTSMAYNFLHMLRRLIFFCILMGPFGEIPVSF